MSLIIFNDEESEHVYHCISVLTKLNHENEVEKVKKNINALVEIVKAISQYPSILANDQLCDRCRSIDTLMDEMSNNEGLDKIMYTPMKAVLGKSYLLAKVNFLNMLLIITKTIPELNDRISFITSFLTNNIYTIMCEEVFLSIVEDKDSSKTIRNRASFLLANVWEYRLTEGINEYAPSLNAIWEARKKLIPIYGTMMGTVELSKISANLAPIWFDFINDKNTPDEVFQSIEEFLFTLTYEELNSLRKKMKAMGINVVNRAKVQKMIGKRQLYDDFDEADRREMYRFFKSRHFNASFRKKADLPGPKKTIEEHLMCYLLSSTKWIPH